MCHRIHLPIGKLLNNSIVIWEPDTIQTDPLFEYLVAVLHAIKLHSYGLLEFVHRALEELMIVVREFDLHAAETGLVEREELGARIIVALYGETAFQVFVPPVLQPFDVELSVVIIVLVEAGSNNVDDTEAGALFDRDERCILVFWHHISTRPFLNEVDFGDRITLVEDALMWRGYECL